MLDESLQVFRENIFSIAGRKQIPHQIYQILEKQLIKEEHGLVEDGEEALANAQDRVSVQNLLEQKDQAALFEFSKQIY